MPRSCLACVPACASEPVPSRRQRQSASFASSPALLEADAPARPLPGWRAPAAVAAGFVAVVVTVGVERPQWPFGDAVVATRDAGSLAGSGMRASSTNTRTPAPRWWPTAA
ncbi:MAG: hypothetical protein U1F49_02860 [Rubrivivax sp.]